MISSKLIKLIFICRDEKNFQLKNFKNLPPLKKKEVNFF